ncbi:hypothetical protein [Mycobacterium sp. AZCC_0083]|uniref:hypothetical protein n=1 Tax=Mycobacterium sp. AZCC_0083 TaxID=2735882 RepID=UPI00160FACBB|nr:hypothetical protein [Mycobacterium sp. AZCC_0083]MBB5161573.1 hypothetical protein [Mycobacterium sp. AZCC_0083]
MPYDEGISDWRVYSAEHAVGHDRQLDAEECQALVEKAMSSDWFHDWFPDAPPIEMIVGGQETPEIEHIWSYAQPHGYPRPTKWTISLHPRMLTARVVLHELAHCVAPIYVEEELKNPGRRRGVPDAMMRRKHRIHGEFFTAALGVITDNMLPGDDGQLARAYRHYEAPISTLHALREQLAGQPAILQDEEAFHDELAKDSAEIDATYEAEHGEPPKWVIPKTPWGFNLEMLRRDRRRRIDGRLISKKLVAEGIAKVTPCTPAHITALEKSRERPEDPEQLKRAMLMAIFLATDPIWVRYNMRLTRWDCGGITMKQARTVNWRWAKMVTHMNKLQREMPPRWYVEGER